MIESNESRLLSLSDEYALDTAAKVPVMSVPAVAQPAQTEFQYTEGVPTEQVPTEAAMSAPAVPQPTQVALEATEQVPIDAALSEPAVSAPTQAVSEEGETIETVHVFTVINDTQRAVYLGIRGIPTREGSGHRRVPLVTGGSSKTWNTYSSRSIESHSRDRGPV
jgi:ribosomal protein L16/L10AE